MTSLVDFLNARYDEEAERAQAAGESLIAWLTYRTDDGQMHYTTVASGDATAEAVDDVWVADGKELPAPAQVLVVYDPARVLREVEAKRRIIAEHYCPDELDADEQPHCGFCDKALRMNDMQGTWPCLHLRLLALPYADHPDYDESWRP